MGKRKKTVPASLKGRKKQKKKPYVVDCLKLPQDVVMGMESATICGDQELTLRHFKSVLAVGSREILLQARRHNLRICGNGLELAYYTLEEVKICGTICSIAYEKRG